jgi:serine/threonine-protein kinase HipA
MTAGADRDLHVLLGGRHIGDVRIDRSSKLIFVYDDAWRGFEGAIPLSLSMPLVASEHPHARIEPFLWGLLPDNALILERWAKRHHVSARNAFALLEHTGEDCAGAVQLVRPDRLKVMLDRNSTTKHVQWLDESEIAERLRLLSIDPSAWRAEADAGQFSLGGAQPKTALLRMKGRWGVPSGRLGTTHILKPPIPGFAGHVENEHFCLRLAGDLGLPVAASEVQRFEDQVAIVIERYDRHTVDRDVVRIHQEDLCQSLGIHPVYKYENEGGPAARAIMAHLRTYSSRSPEDAATFADALIFNWMIAGTDAHAKNYSVLLGASAAVRLAPLYDIASALPYPDLRPQKLKLAMKVGGKYRLSEIGSPQWRKEATALGLEPDATVARAVSMAEATPDYATDLRKQLRRDALDHSILDTLHQRLVARAQLLARTLR